MAQIFQKRYTYKGKTRKTTNWYGRWKDHNDETQEGPLGDTRGEAQRALVRKEEEVEQARRGIHNPHQKHAGVPLLDHLAVWETIIAETNGRHAANRVGHVKRILAGCNWKYASDWTASALQLWLAKERKDQPMPALDPDQEWFTRAEIAALTGAKLLSVSVMMRRHDARDGCTGGGPTRRFSRASVLAVLEQRRRGISNATACHYLKDIKGFAEWMVEDNRIQKNPFTHLKGFNKEIDQRRCRQSLTLQEMQHIFNAAAKSPETRYQLTGPERSMLYVVAASSGFRLSELAALRVRHILLDDDGQVVIHQPKVDSKNKKGATQPLPEDAGQALMKWIEAKEPQDSVWPDGQWVHKGAEMLHADLDDAGLPYCIDGPDGPLYADFHSLRHSYIALLEHSGLTVREQMLLARHSDPKLTIKVYARAAGQRRSKLAIKKLPKILSAETSTPAALAALTLQQRGEMAAWSQNPQFLAEMRRIAAELGLAAQPLRIAGGSSE